MDVERGTDIRRSVEGVIYCHGLMVDAKEDTA